MVHPDFVKRPYFKVGLIGVLAIIIALIIQQIFPKESAQMTKGFSTPIIYFEFIQTPAEINDFFGITDKGKPNESFVRQMDSGNYVDFAFMIVYSAFLFFFFRKLRQIKGIRWFKTGMLLASIALLSDFIENIQLLAITANLGSGDYLSQLSLLKVFTWIKWASLAFCFLLFSIYLFKSESLYKLVGFIPVLPFALGSMALFNRGFITEMFAKSISVSFFVMICYCFLYLADTKLDYKK
jgi:hypothetical protein